MLQKYLAMTMVPTYEGYLRFCKSYRISETMTEEQYKDNITKILPGYERGKMNGHSYDAVFIDEMVEK